MDYMTLRSLVAAVESGSLTAAARRMGISQPAISQKLSALERSLGHQLLIRSRRGVRPTPAGELAYSHGLRVLDSVAEMEAALEALRGEVAGRLRVTVNVLLSQTVMGPVIAELRQRHPRLRVDVVTSDQLVDLEAEGIDIAVRSGGMGTGPGRIRRIGSMAGVLVASPAYLASVGHPRGPEELARLGYVQYRNDPEEYQIALEHGGGMVLAPVVPAFAAQHPDLTLHAVINGLGFAKAPLFYVREKLKDGVLQTVLPGYAPVAKPIYLLQLDHVRDTHRAAAFRDVLMAHLARVDGISVLEPAAA